MATTRTVVFDAKVYVTVEGDKVTAVHVDDENLKINASATRGQNSGATHAELDAAVETAEAAEWPGWDFGGA